MKNKMKITSVGCCVLLSALVIAGIAYMKQDGPQTEEVSREENHSGTDVPDDVNTYVVSTTSDLAIDIASPVEMSKISRYVALVTIDSIDGADNYSEVSQRYVSPYTYGRMTVLQNFQGELPVGKSLKFYRLGGTLSVARYYEGLTEVEKERFDFVKADDNKLSSAEQIKVTDMEDIDIEAGKTYLVYMVDESAYHAEPNTYAIIGYQGGLREVQSPNDKARQTSATKVLNNFTGQWEDLNETIPSVQQ